MLHKYLKCMIFGVVAIFFHENIIASENGKEDYSGDYNFSDDNLHEKGLSDQTVLDDALEDYRDRSTNFLKGDLREDRLFREQIARKKQAACKQAVLQRMHIPTVALMRSLSFASLSDTDQQSLEDWSAQANKSFYVDSSNDSGELFSLMKKEEKDLELGSSGDQSPEQVHDWSEADFKIDLLAELKSSQVIVPEIVKHDEDHVSL